MFEGILERNRRAVILAGGDGSRLSELTRLITGEDCPKQFCPIFGDETLLSQTRKRLERIVAPENILFSVTEKHSNFYKRQLKDIPGERITIQPDNKGTAPAVLFCLMRIFGSAPDSTVAFFPSDHFFADENKFASQVIAAFRAAELNPDSAILLGITPSYCETEYGWIEAGTKELGTNGIAPVIRFWEKPSLEKAEFLMRKGCLWNSFVMIGKCRTFLGMIAAALPSLYRRFLAIREGVSLAEEERIIRDIYKDIDSTNFSSEVLEVSHDSLFVMPVSNVGWNDLGKPERVFLTMKSLGLQPRWEAALAA